MCGIAGILTYSKGIEASAIRKMTDLISHRGPDDYGFIGVENESGLVHEFKVNPPEGGLMDIYLGHRRLSILDLSEAGHQPMSYADNRYWITYNGEIYNYIELRDELKSAGFQFRTNTDTEVILAAYTAWGVNCINKFNGMWSFALLDIKEHKLFCARDRMGVKPFYYNLSNGRFAFASEIKQLLSLPWIERGENQNSLSDFFFWGKYNSIGSDTFFKSVTELGAGKYFVIDTKDAPSNINQITYWDIDPSVKIEKRSDEEYAKHYLELFYDSVKLRLRSDVPVGTALSGGLDSSGIVCMVGLLNKESGISGLQKTFTAQSDIPRFDETEYANEVIKSTEVEPFYTIPSAEWLLKDYEKLIWHQEELFVSTSIFAGWCVSNLTKANGVTVSLDGQGPDEMLGGYYPAATILAQNLSRIEPGQFFQNYTAYRQSLGFSHSELIRKIIGTFVAAGIRYDKLPSSVEKFRLFNPEYFNSKILPHLVGHHRNKMSFERNPFDTYSYNAVRSSPLPGILRQVDRNSMAFSLESRVPFLDYRLVEYVFSLPMRQKVQKGLSKIVYRNAMKGILPEKVRTRPTKLGFVTAEPEWLKTPELSRLFIEVFLDIRSDSLISRDYVLNRFRSFLAGESAFDTIFWRVFNYEIWKKIFLGNFGGSTTD